MSLDQRVGEDWHCFGRFGLRTSGRGTFDRAVTVGSNSREAAGGAAATASAGQSPASLRRMPMKGQCRWHAERFCGLGAGKSRRDLLPLCSERKDRGHAGFPVGAAAWRRSGGAEPAGFRDTCQDRPLIARPNGMAVARTTTAQDGNILVASTGVTCEHTDRTSRGHCAHRSGPLANAAGRDAALDRPSWRSTSAGET